MTCCTNRLEKFNIEKDPNHVVIALAGNPNVGKSTLFNALTGLRQHTGNWPGKTVSQAHGTFEWQDRTFLIVDLPGTYSLLSNSADEQVARDFLCFAGPEITFVVLDATSLERNLNLALQVLEITSKVIVCVNLMDEAKRKEIYINLKKLSRILGIPVIGMSARSGKGIIELKDTMIDLLDGKVQCSPPPFKYGEKVENALAVLEPEVKELIQGAPVNSRWVALRLIDGDRSILESLQQFLVAEKAAGETKEASNTCPKKLIID